MSNDSTPSFTILGQGIRDVSFENKLEVGANIEAQPEINIDIQANGNKVADNTYEVVLSVRAQATHQSKTLFILELLYMGICQTQNITPELIPQLLMVQVPTLLFPYARQIVSDLTSNAGFPPMLLQPVDFAALYQQQSQENAVAGNA